MPAIACCRVAASIAERGNTSTNAGGVGRPEGLDKGYYVKPTVFANVTNDMTIAKEEIFGPVVSILGYDTVDQAIEIGNDTEYGLAAYISGTDMNKVRAVASPDMRPEFVRYGLERRLLAVKTGAKDEAKSPHPPVGSAPPRGPRAPWTLGFEESDPNVSIEDLFLATSPEGTPQASTPDICGKQDLHQVIKYLCRRMDERSNYDKGALFRSTLDAYDRHEIVLLSSAWGLPVRGRRETPPTPSVV